MLPPKHQTDDRQFTFLPDQMIHPPTIDSSTLLTVTVSEIGRISYSMDTG